MILAESNLGAKQLSDQELLLDGVSPGAEGSAEAKGPLGSILERQRLYAARNAAFCNNDKSASGTKFCPNII